MSPSRPNLPKVPGLASGVDLVPEWTISAISRLFGEIEVSLANGPLIDPAVLTIYTILQVLEERETNSNHR
jgi:hypothetical protein